MGKLISLYREGGYAAHALKVIKLNAYGQFESALPILILTLKNDEVIFGSNWS